MIKKIDELFDLIPSYPGLNVCLVDGFGILDNFVRFSKDNEITLHIKMLKDVDMLDGGEFIKYEKFDFNDKRYNQHSILYDFVFICMKLDDIDLEEMLRKFYRTIKNAGYIYLFVEPDKKDEIITLLESVNYVSVNEIDRYDSKIIISAQKMHGWMRV